ATYLTGRKKHLQPNGRKYGCFLRGHLLPPSEHWYSYAMVSTGQGLLPDGCAHPSYFQNGVLSNLPDPHPLHRRNLPLSQNLSIPHSGSIHTYIPAIRFQSPCGQSHLFCHPASRCKTAPLPWDYPVHPKNTYPQVQPDRYWLRYYRG